MRERQNFRLERIIFSTSISSKSCLKVGLILFQGILCGQCDPGYSTEYFANCIKNEDCKPITFWLAFVIIGIVYVLWCLGLAWLTFEGQRPRSSTLLDQRVTYRNQRVELEPVSDTANLTENVSRASSEHMTRSSEFINGSSG